MPWQWILVELWLVWISVREPRLHSNLKRTPPVPADQRRCASQRLREEALRGRLRVPGSALSTVLVCQRRRGIQDSGVLEKPSHDQKMWSVENTECRNTEYRITRAQHTHTAFLSGLCITGAECDSEKKPQGAAPERMLHAQTRRESRHSAESSRQRKPRDKGYGNMQSSGEARPWASELTSARHGSCKSTERYQLDTAASHST